MADLTARNALQRSISARLNPCSEEELRALDRMLIAIEKRRDILEVGRQCPNCDADPLLEHGHNPPQIPARPFVHASDDVMRGLRELRDSATYSREPRVPTFTVIDGGDR